MTDFAGDIQQIELTMQEAKDAIELQQCLVRLSENKDFIKLISKGLFEEEATRVVGAKAEMGMIMNEAGMTMIDNIITTIGGLRQYFIKVQQQGNSAQGALADHQETHTELLREQLEEGSGVH